jgi:hypothetical protein
MVGPRQSIIFGPIPSIVLSEDIKTLTTVQTVLKLRKEKHN